VDPRSYGLAEFKSATPPQTGHDEVEITSANFPSDAKTVRCSSRDVKRMQMMIQMHIKAGRTAPHESRHRRHINRVRQE